MAQCTECGLETAPLFSNRPLHRGRDTTLLICLECVGIATEDTSTGPGPCAWCGADASTVATSGERRICRRCVDLCHQLAPSSAD